MPDTGAGYTLDTVVLSNFTSAEALWLLRTRYAGRMFITTEVMDEIEAGAAAGYPGLTHIESLARAGVSSLISLAPAERATYRDLLASLSEGEASCIAAAIGRDLTVATDDLRARNVCRERGLRVTGSVGILKAACLAGDITLDQGEQMLADMVVAGFFSPVSRLADIL